MKSRFFTAQDFGSGDTQYFAEKRASYVHFHLIFLSNTE
jgi:hypothetical protein